MKPASGFAIWITGLPSSGKSTITKELVRILHSHGIAPVVLESDSLRKVLTPEPTFTQNERDRFYEQMVLIGEIISQCGVPVIFDATANLRAYRDKARAGIQKFVEVYIDTPLDECKKRDPKGIYAKAAAGEASSVPGLQTAYEPPINPELKLDGRNNPTQNASQIVNKLKELEYL